ncbi:hypothetical protein N7454_005527, partial [Penicillium verhagenii]
KACEAFNAAAYGSRRQKVQLWRNIIGDTRPLPEELQDSKADEALFGETDPYVDGPISIDHALNFKVGKQSFLNFNPLGPRHMPHHCQLGKNVLFGPNVGLYGALHPMDPAKRRGLKDPEAEKEIHIEDDVWIGAGATILGGVRIGRGSTVGASSVVTKDVPPFHFVAGNPARIIRKIESEINPGFKGNAGVDEGQ